MLLTFAGIFVQLRNKKKFGGKYAGDYDDISIESPVQPTQDYVEMKVIIIFLVFKLFFHFLTSFFIKCFRS